MEQIALEAALEASVEPIRSLKDSPWRTMGRLEWPNALEASVRNSQIRGHAFHLIRVGLGVRPGGNTISPRKFFHCAAALEAAELACIRSGQTIRAKWCKSNQCLTVCPWRTMVAWSVHVIHVLGGQRQLGAAKDIRSRFVSRGTARKLSNQAFGGCAEPLKRYPNSCPK